jgi:hypothetical protein
LCTLNALNPKKATLFSPGFYAPVLLLPTQFFSKQFEQDKY